MKDRTQRCDRALEAYASEKASPHQNLREPPMWTLQRRSDLGEVQHPSWQTNHGSGQCEWLCSIVPNRNECRVLIEA